MYTFGLKDGMKKIKRKANKSVVCRLKSSVKIKCWKQERLGLKELCCGNIKEF